MNSILLVAMSVLKPLVAKSVSGRLEQCCKVNDARFVAGQVVCCWAWYGAHC
jgi:hypothetical protein